MHVSSELVKTVIRVHLSPDWPKVDHLQHIIEFLSHAALQENHFHSDPTDKRLNCEHYWKNAARHTTGGSYSLISHGLICVHFQIEAALTSSSRLRGRELSKGLLSSRHEDTSQITQIRLAPRKLAPETNLSAK
jgi:hypothetical protein